MRGSAPLALLIACAGPDEVAPIAPAELPLEEGLYTALSSLWAPKAPSEQVKGQISDGSLRVTDLDRFLDAGLGVTRDPGQPWIEHTELAPDFVAGATGTRRSLAWIWQAADPQLIDEESPIRMEAFEGLYRPNGHLTVQVFTSHVQTAARVADAVGRPFDLVMVAGDLTDGSQRNELRWFFEALEGGVIDPDSGVDDDPVPGPANDYGDPFVSPGLDAPWYAALGNHETQYNGGFGVVDEALLAAAVGTEVYDFPVFANGFRDGTTEHGEVRTEGPTPADPDRLVLDRPGVLGALLAAPGAPPGHGLTAEDVQAERGWFSVHPVDGLPLRLVVLDTVNTYGGTGAGASGVFSAAQHTWLQAELEAADEAHELVMVMSHHRPSDLGAGSEVGEEELLATLSGCEGLVLHVCGHVHENLKRLRQPPDAVAGQGYWELTLASTVDFPMHSRFLELVDEGTGFLSVYATNTDHHAPEGSLPHLAREQAAAKLAFGEILPPEDVDEVWISDLRAQNLLLRWKLPDAVRAAISGLGEPEISSEELASW